MGEEERELTQRWATCLTVGCGSYGAHMHILTVEGCDIECGACQEPITNIADIKPEEGTVLPEWILEQLATQNSGN